MSDQDVDRRLRVFVLIPIIANVLTILAGIVIYNRGEVGAEMIPLALLALAAPWGIGFFAGRLIDVFLDRRDSAEDGFI